jgi:transcriptional regulator with XRE-family HTH domain
MIPVTPELVERVRALRASGLTLRRVARECGAGLGTIHKLLAGVPALSPPPEPSVAPRGCQWLFGERPGWTFCGAVVDRPGSPWCSAHRRICYSGKGGWS